MKYLFMAQTNRGIERGNQGASSSGESKRYIHSTGYIGTWISVAKYELGGDLIVVV